MSVCFEAQRPFNVNHKEYGLVNPLILDLRYESHFRLIKSQFMNSLLKWKKCN